MSPTTTDPTTTVQFTLDDGKEIRVPYYDGQPESLQRYFDKTVQHLVGQGSQAKNPATGFCVFRDAICRACAIGAHIPTGYKVSNDLDPLSILDYHMNLTGIVMPNSPAGHGLADALVAVHDDEENWSPSKFTGFDQLLGIAREYGLNSSLVGSLQVY